MDVRDHINIQNHSWTHDKHYLCRESWENIVRNEFQGLVLPYDATQYNRVDAESMWPIFYFNVVVCVEGGYTYVNHLWTGQSPILIVPK